MRPFVLLEIENGEESDTTVVGDSQILVTVIDWDKVEIDPDSAHDLIDEIRGRYMHGDTAWDSTGDGIKDAKVKEVLERLQEIADESDREWDDEEDDYREWDDEEDDRDGLVLGDEMDTEDIDREW